MSGSAAPSEALLACRRHAGRHVLVAEDNRVNQQIAAALLRAAGLEVELVDDGRQAVDRLAAGAACDLVLMDVQMPVLDGLDATREIRRLPGRERLPILAMTGHASDDDQHRCREAGMDGHVVKPMAPAQLYTQLAHWLDRAAA